MKKFSNTVMLLLVIAALIYFYMDSIMLKIDAPLLVNEYSANVEEADNKYLNKTLELSGKVKAFYELSEIGNVLELQDYNDEILLYCFFINKKDEERGRLFNQSDTIKLVGICDGLKFYQSAKVLKFAVKQIKIWFQVEDSHT